ncbi:hypothetical protein ASV53_21740 [Photobacterium sanguinicancri]|uniref:Uncharacterized protein n=2 Tax=Photobacterium sanguinicancri TaxID=875932 RepID=A0ABX4FSI9_9GAMM|nr:hypothetical protein ASV53_21740 [Photobacterium sanguinicancri]
MTNRSTEQKCDAPMPEQLPLAISIIEQIKSLESLNHVTVYTPEDKSKIVINSNEAKTQSLTLYWNVDGYMADCTANLGFSGVSIRSAGCAGIFAFAYDVCHGFQAKWFK